MVRLGACALAVVLVLIFIIRGIILPIANKIGGGSGSSNTIEQTADTQTDTTETDENSAIRIPLKNQNNLTKASQLVAGWHEDDNGKWYQNTDGTFYAGGMQDIDGTTYYFDDNGYIQTGWITLGSEDYYFNDDGSYDATVHKPMIALTFDDGPGEYTDKLLDCLEENNAHATFFMVGQNVGSYTSTVQRMVEIGCEIGSHTWDHADLANLDSDSIAEELNKTDEALEAACGQKASVIRAPYGDYNETVLSVGARPFFMWSTDSLDWSLMDADKDYDSVMNDDSLSDGSIVLMHDIHEPSVEAAIRIIPDLIAKGYKLVTVSEMAAAKGVTLQNASYSDFWDSSLAKGIVAGYEGNTTDSSEESTDGSDESGDGSEESSDGSEDSGDSGDYSEDGSGDSSDSGDYSEDSSEYSDDSGDYTDESSEDYAGDESEDYTEESPGNYTEDSSGEESY